MKKNKIYLFCFIIPFMLLILFITINFFKSGNLNVENKISNIKSIPDILGIQTHIASGSVDVDAIKDHGFKIVRDDILWSRVEKEKGKYDYLSTGYDDYNERLKNNGIRPYYILSYSNELYEKNKSVVTKEGLEAYVNFVKETSKRYKNQNIIWEIWNEPNIEYFWSPAFTSVYKYTELVKNASKEIKKNDPSGIVVGPALSELNETSLQWLEETFKLGLLDDIDALSVHPYRGTEPESVIDDYKNLKDLISKYTKKEVPIFSGEWGYPSGGIFHEVRLNQRQQTRYLVRMFLVNVYQGIPINIWYDWKNDGEDKENSLHNFGIREFDQSLSKEAALGAKTLINNLDGYHFSKRVKLENKNDYLLEFINGEKKVFIYWTTENDHYSNWPNNDHYKGTLINMLGANIGLMDTKNKKMHFTNSPIYLKVEND